MTLDLTALYIIVDDLYQKHYAHLKPRRPGRRPELSDSEVLTLSIWAQWFGTSERDHEHVRTVGDCGWAGKRLGEHVVEHRGPACPHAIGVLLAWNHARSDTLSEHCISSGPEEKSTVEGVGAHRGGLGRP